MLTQEIREIIIHELPEIVRHDEEIHQLIIHIASGQFSDKYETDSRFDRILDELRRDREEQAKRWEGQKTQWAETNQTILRILDRLEHLDDRVDRVHQRIDQTIGAIGARWGLYAEQAFLNGLKAIVEESFGVKVIQVTEWDETGEVFGRPDQVELDLIMHNGQLLICEIKSSISKSEVHIFERKVRYYEKAHNRLCNRMLIISPMVDEKAKKLAQELGIEVYTHAADATVIGQV